MDESQERMIRKIKENSLKQRQIREDERIREEHYKLKKEQKDSHKKVYTLI